MEDGHFAEDDAYDTLASLRDYRCEVPDLRSCLLGGQVPSCAEAPPRDAAGFAASDATQ